MNREKVIKMLEERSHLEGEHQIWDGTIVEGYGCVKIEEKTYKAHRLSALLYVPGYFEGAIVMHLCDRKDCISPKHIKWGTKRENAIDLVETGGNRQSRNKGEKNGMKKLSDEEVQRIRELCAKGMNQYAIADLFGVRQSTVSRIKHLARRG